MCEYRVKINGKYTLVYQPVERQALGKIRIFVRVQGAVLSRSAVNTSS